MNDEQHDPESAMERFHDLLGKLVSVSKEDVAKIERAAEELVQDALGPPPAGSGAIEDEAE